MASGSKAKDDRYRLPADAERRSRRLAEERFARYLRDHDLKLTPERRAILREFYGIHEHILGREAHEHMICLGCDRIIEWLDPELTGLVFRNCAAQDFSPARHSLQVFGYCEECADTSEAEEALELGEDANLTDAT